MLNFRFSVVVVLCGLCMAATSMAQELRIFPNADQSPEQQEQDKFVCYGWAKGESSFDPMAPPTATEPPPQEEAKKGGVGRGLVRGAAIGGIVGGSSGAKRGAGAGVVIGGMRSQDQKRKEAQAREQWEQEQVRIYTENRNRYNRAYAACLEGKNYTVR